MEGKKVYGVVEKNDPTIVIAEFQSFEEANDYRKEFGFSNYLVKYPDGKTYPSPINN